MWHVMKIRSIFVSGDNILYKKKMFYEYKIFSSMLYVILFYYEVLKQYGIKERVLGTPSPRGYFDACVKIPKGLNILS